MHQKYNNKANAGQAGGYNIHFHRVPEISQIGIFPNLSGPYYKVYENWRQAG
jgi:hypothetical protein